MSNYKFLLFILYIIYIYSFNLDYNKEYVGESLKSICLDYGTFGIKIGQVFSNRTDIFDTEICNILNDLRDKVPGLTEDENLQLIKKIEDNIQCKSINHKPIGSGCIAIVYKAVLENNESVVIKIKRFGILQKMDDSMEKIEKLLYYANYIPLFRDMELDKRLVELKELIYNQLDFTNELKETVYFYNKYKKHSFITTPKPYLELSNEDLIVLEYVNGLKVNELDNITKEKISVPFAGFLISSMFLDGHYHGDLHSGNLMLINDKICIYDFGLVFRFNNDEKKMVYEYYISLMNKKWDNSANILLNNFCETEIENKEDFKNEIIKILIKHFELNTKWDPVSYIRDVSCCIKKYNSAMVKSYVSWELSMITVQGVITEICKKNIWELCREINDIYDLH